MKPQTALARRYREVYKDPILAQFEMVKRAGNYTDAYIERSSGVSSSCLRAWRKDGKTRRPQHLTLVFAFRAMGYKFGLEKA